VLYFVTPGALEEIVAIATVAECPRKGINGNVIFAVQLSTVVAGVVIIRAILADVECLASAMAVNGYHVVFVHPFLTVFTVHIVTVSTVFADVFVTSYMIDCLQ